MSVGTGIGLATVIGGGLAAAGGVTSAIIGSHAATSAADTQAASADKATALSYAEWQKAQEDQAPWLQAGKTSLSQLMEGIGPGGSLVTPYSGEFKPPNSVSTPDPFKPPTLEEARNTPGYKFALESGNIGLEHGASTAGGVFSTQTLNNEQKFGQALGQQAYQQTFDNAQSAYQQNVSNSLALNQNAYNQSLNNYLTNFNTYNTNQANMYNRLASSSGLGQTTATNLGLQGASTAATIGNNITGSGAAKAGGIVGSANAITAGLTNGINGITGALTLSQIMNGNRGNSGIPTVNTNNRDPTYRNQYDIGLYDPNA